MRRSLLVLIAVALAVCYGSTLLGMFDQWRNDEDMGHGFVVPIVVGWIVWRERDRWRSVRSEGSRWGYVVLAMGAGLQTLAMLGGGLFAASLAFLVSIVGVVLCVGGPALLRAWIFPLLLSLFMLPKLAVVYNQVTLPLQLFASRMAAGILAVAGAGVIREGNILIVGGHSISVAEACSGIRYVLPLGFFAVVFAYLSDPKPWMRIALLIAAVPVAVLANAVRVAFAASMPALDAGAPHAILGVALFVTCLALLMFTRRGFNAVYAFYRV